MPRMIIQRGPAARAARRRGHATRPACPARPRPPERPAGIATAPCRPRSAVTMSASGPVQAATPASARPPAARRYCPRPEASGSCPLCATVDHRDHQRVDACIAGSKTPPVARISMAAYVPHRDRSVANGRRARRSPAPQAVSGDHHRAGSSDPPASGYGTDEDLRQHGDSIAVARTIADPVVSVSHRPARTGRAYCRTARTPARPYREGEPSFRHLDCLGHRYLTGCIKQRYLLYDDTSDPTPYVKFFRFILNFSGRSGGHIINTQSNEKLPGAQRTGQRTSASG